MGLAWTDNLSVGNAIIDSDHKKLITMINSAECMIHKRDSFALSQAFDQIECWLHVHFSNEEIIAQAIGFSFVKNNLDHEYLLKTFRLMRDVIVGKNGVWDEGAAEHYSEFLSDWFTCHIIREDMLMKPILLTYPYNYKPIGAQAESVVTAWAGCDVAA